MNQFYAPAFRDETHPAALVKHFCVGDGHRAGLRDIFRAYDQTSPRAERTQIRQMSYVGTAKRVLRDGGHFVRNAKARGSGEPDVRSLKYVGSNPEPLEEFKDRHASTCQVGRHV